MTARLIVRESSQALWSRRVAFFAIQLLVLVTILHRFEVIATPVASNLLTAGIGVALVGLLMACGALYKIFRYDLSGTGRALAGLTLAILALAVPMWYVPDLVMRPRLTDISTAIDQPLRFEALVAERPEDANPVDGLDPRLNELQASAYPDIRPISLEKSATQTFELVRDAVEKLGWKIVASKAPEANAAGRIEAVARTPIMGFKDDVVIRVSSGKGEATIDVRSASRYGEHDFGANARRIRLLFAQVESGLEQGEKLAREMVLARRAEELREAREKRLARERTERETRDAREREELLRVMRERNQPPAVETPRSEQALAPADAQGEQARTEQRPQRGWIQDPYKFWQQFSN